MLRYAADSVDGVRARRCTVRARVADDAPDGTAGWVDVEMSLILRYGVRPGEQVLAAVRRAVLAVADARIGLRVARCDLLVEDVWTADGPDGD